MDRPAPPRKCRQKGFLHPPEVWWVQTTLQTTHETMREIPGCPAARCGATFRQAAHPRGARCQEGPPADQVRRRAATVATGAPVDVSRLRCEIERRGSWCTEGSR